MQSKNKIVLYKITSIFIGCLIALIICEIVLRIYTPFQSRIKGHEIKLITNHHRQLKLEVSNSTVDSFVTHSTNSLGFRGDEKPKEIENRFVVFTVGGSTTECSLLDDEKTWSAILAKDLLECKSDVWLNNAGIDGCSTYGHLILLREHLIKHKPDMILFLVGANDLLKGHYGLKDSFLKYGPRYKKRSLMAKSELFSLALNLYRHSYARRAQVNHSFNQKEIKEQSDQTLLNRVQRHVDNQTPYTQRLDSIISICRKNDILPVFMTQPIFIRSKHDLCYEIYIYNQTLINVSNDHNIPVIDLASKLAPDPSYYYDNMHYTNEGAQAVADIVKNALCDSVFISMRQHINSH